MKIAIIGWGSLLWDDRPDFDQYHDVWQFDGPTLKLEFSRISVRRQRALTLVLEDQFGVPCQVAYALSKRSNPFDVVYDLRIREGATNEQIGLYFTDPCRNKLLKRTTPEAVSKWADETDFDAVLWTALPNNFQQLSEGRESFSLPAATKHLQSLNPAAIAKAVEYIERAPDFIQTPLRTKLQTLEWFAALRE